MYLMKQILASNVNCSTLPKYYLESSTNKHKHTRAQIWMQKSLSFDVTKWNLWRRFVINKKLMSFFCICVSAENIAAPACKIVTKRKLKKARRLPELNDLLGNERKKKKYSFFTLVYFNHLCTTTMYGRVIKFFQNIFFS